MHNSRQVEEFKTLYGNKVLFYGRNYTGHKCYQRKKAFLTPEFYQELITPLTISYYSSGTIKCAFKKRVIFRKTIKEHEAYLLLEKKNDEYIVTGESDLVTDKNLGVTLNLGDLIKADEPKTASLIWWGVGCIALAGAAFYLRRRKKEIKEVVKDQEPELYETYVTAKQPAVVELELVDKVREAVKEEMKDILKDDSPEKKGYDFEKYVVEKFDKVFFKVIEWRSDKYHKGHYAQNSLLPDIVMHYQDTTRERTFAIECKWRTEFYRGKVDIAKARQLETYRQYERETNIPVFFILGLGGKPSEPEDLFVIPLKQLHAENLSQYQLRKFQRHKRGSFFLRTGAMVLE